MIIKIYLLLYFISFINSQYTEYTYRDRATINSNLRKKQSINIHNSKPSSFSESRISERNPNLKPKIDISSPISNLNTNFNINAFYDSNRRPHYDIPNNRNNTYNDNRKKFEDSLSAQERGFLLEEETTTRRLLSTQKSSSYKTTESSNFNNPGKDQDKKFFTTQYLLSNNTKRSIIDELFTPKFNTPTYPSLIINSTRPLNVNYDVQVTYQNNSPCGNNNITLNNMPELITSPGWKEGKKYPANSNCTWIIYTPNISLIKMPSIKMKILHFETEKDKNCKYDYLEIKNFKKLCGFIKNKEIVFNTTQLELIFRSDDNFEDKGFKLIFFYESERCTPEIKTSSFGILTSPGFPNEYPDTAKCCSLIDASSFVVQNSSKNVSITITFEFVLMEQEATELCSYDYVEVIEVNEDLVQIKSLGRFCNFNPDIAKIISENESDSVSSSDTNKLQVKSMGHLLLLCFNSDSFVNSRGFKANYKVETLERTNTTNCDWSPNKKERTLSSPNYPNHYPPNKNCSLILEAPKPNQKILIIFESFMIEKESNCIFDRLEIYEEIFDSNILKNTEIQESTLSNEPAKVLCGHLSAKFQYLSKGSRIKLRFISDNFAEYFGFMSKYSFIDSHIPISSSIVTEFIKTPQNASIIAGSSHLLSCIPKNKKHDIPVLWFKDETPIKNGLFENGTKLLIQEFTASSQGRYKCKYDKHEYYASLSLKSSLCQLTFIKRPQNMILFENDVAIVECRAVSPLNFESNETIITWSKDGVIISKNSRIDILKNGFLFINDVQSNDTGYYNCIVQINNTDCKSESIAKIEVNEKVNVEKICGRPILGRPSKTKPNINSYGKIVGGIDSQKGAFPWQVMFWDSMRKSFCGGVLLNERWIATAAHCFTKIPSSGPIPSNEFVKVRLGKYDQKEKEPHEIVISIQQVIKHPSFNKNTFDNDLALVRLTEHIKFSDYIIPICLGKNPDIIEKAFFDETKRILRMGHVTGWGQLKESGPHPRYLQELRMPIVAREVCKMSTSFKITHNMFCAGYEQELIGDACKGDSGGPFVGMIGERWYLLGIVSWGEGCARSGKYGFYTKVNNYANWIYDVMKY